jgi:hypothetical protein
MHGGNGLLIKTNKPKLNTKFAKKPNCNIQQKYDFRKGWILLEEITAEGNTS